MVVLLVVTKELILKRIGCRFQYPFEVVLCLSVEKLKDSRQVFRNLFFLFQDS